MSNCDCDTIKMSNVATEDVTCPGIGYQTLSVCVPVTVTPFANARTTITKCCGNPKVTAGSEVCEGRKNGSCSFTISQKICVEVPVDFGARAAVGDTFVDCLEVSNEDICKDCAYVE